MYFLLTFDQELAGWVANCVDPDMQAVVENIQALQARIPETLLGTVIKDSNLIERSQTVS